VDEVCEHGDYGKSNEGQHGLSSLLEVQQAASLLQLTQNKSSYVTLFMGGVNLLYSA
jgi:hypothetical protein